MANLSLLRLAGLAPGDPDRRAVWSILFAILLLYSAAFLIFYPVGATNDDEALYVNQARMLLQGTQTKVWIHPATGASIAKRPSEYPVGTAALMAPAIALFGESGAWLLSLVAVLIGVLVTARWLADEGRSPLYALLVLGYVPTLVIGRVAMSDAPSLAVVALGLWLFWRGLAPGAAVGWWLASGLVAGASIALRETNALPFVGFYAGTLVRRERRCLALIAGGLAGVSLRLLGQALAYGDPFVLRQGNVGFGWYALQDNLAMHLLALLVLVPGGLGFAFAYRGRRWPELIAGVVLYVLVHLFHWFGPPSSGFAKRVVIELRYYIPLLPLLVFAMAEAVPRLWRRLERRPERRFFEAGAQAALLIWLATLATASVMVHFALSRWSQAQVSIRDDIGRVCGDSVLVTDWWATRKFIREIDRSFLPLDRADTSPEQVAEIARLHGTVCIAFLDRSDSEIWRADALENEAFVAALRPQPALEVDRRVTPTDRLRIWRVVSDDDAPRDGAPKHDPAAAAP